MQEAKMRAALNEEPVDYQAILHLMILQGSVRTLHYLSWDEKSKQMGWKDILHQIDHELEPLMPSRPEDLMFKFPYKEMKRRFDLSTIDLNVFGQRLFHTSDEYAFLHSDVLETEQEKFQDKQYRGCMITRHHYEALKADSGTYQEWLTDEDLNLTYQWFQRNSESYLSDCFDVIQSDFVTLVTGFYHTMMNSEGTRNGVQHAFDIHCYLIKNHSFLFKRFVFFPVNVDQNHWITCCLCNPWMLLLKQWKGSEMPQLPAVLEKSV